MCGIFYTWWSPWLFWRAFKALSAFDLSSRALMAYKGIIIQAWEIIMYYKVVSKTIWTLKTQLKMSEWHGIRYKISKQVVFILKKHSASSLLKLNISQKYVCWVLYEKIMFFRVQILSEATVCITFTNILRHFLGFYYYYFHNFFTWDSKVLSLAFNLSLSSCSLEIS